MKGGGHGSASRDFGLGADQALELAVVLADGSLVTANACLHSDLFFALRGGGGGTYGAGNRLVDRASVTQNFSALRTMIGTIDGTLDQFTTNNLELVGGGQVFRDASEPYSGVTPAWRISYFNSVVARVSSFDTPQAVPDEKQHDIILYMDEADRFDPDWKADFNGRKH
ncbi:uncharacterized protein A1O5_09668 [Cladophialophora psammophila CBS 110553]|uniref:FAD linked oxidase N-terminal domain-containing protein n=1 Tax=Cladophialophora psammophila CBS 110553 TaxID=1182543 RepID=W9WFX8_9EURO|nr:uncharacterized protein A1O5_09668 [Cladophialophora psammophila CBS 110553]EXJ67022.1 hypothetical protein A1O5_09668 [Cladophialophora psammophila CBS 110553]